MQRYKLKVGLETHIELLTDTKIFCSCSAKYSNIPNSNTCEICLGMPGALPNLNKKAVLYAVKMGLYLNTKINKYSKMARKNYTYPDLVKGYQITQSDEPVCKDGYIILKNGRKIRIKQIHIEEDAGKQIRTQSGYLIDYNRAGVGLIEIVTEPDFDDSEDVITYLEAIRLNAKYLGITDAKMEEGSLRCDVNVSLVDTLTNINYPRCEIKNLNSISMVKKAIEKEYERQVNLLSNGKDITMSTLRYDEKEDKTQIMRLKEDEDDYRYFYEPDILKIEITPSMIDEAKGECFVLADEKIDEYIKKYNFSYDDAYQIVKYKKVSNLFDKLTLLTNDAKMCLSFILKYLYSFLKEDDQREKLDIGLDEIKISNFLISIKNKEISQNLTKTIFSKMLTQNKNWYELYDKNEVKPIDENELENIVKKVISSNEKIVSDYKNGKEKAFFALVGSVMKESNKRADAIKTEKLLKRIIFDNSPIL